LGFGAQELIIILLILLVIFGGKKIPELARGLGRGMKEFKKAGRDDDEVGEVDKDRLDPPKKEA
jgi:sec-independent protein translocase protein TatA